MPNYGGSAKEADWYEQPGKIGDIIIDGHVAPTVTQLEAWMGEGGCEAVGCGCWIEPDGTCECGNPSWFLFLGMI